MKGIEIARGYYENFGKPMLERDFSDIMPYIAVGFCGSGSEHYGYDDELSRDHDFEPGFCIFLPGEDIVDRKRAFQLERSYAKLPSEYAGVARQTVSPVGGSRHGVMRTDEYFTKAAGSPDGKLTVAQWLTLPDYVLAEAVNGEIFFDNYGEVNAIRERLILMPEDIKLKRIAGNLLIMAQAGQYNFLRCMKHGEPEAAQLACNEFVNAAMKAVFLLNDRYMPYYKWSFRALREMGNTEDIAKMLSYLLCSDNTEKADAGKKYLTIEHVSSVVVSMLRDRELTDAVCGDLEKHACSVNDKISDPEIRNLHILACVR